jgi:hypothetical protein
MHLNVRCYYSGVPGFLTVTFACITSYTTDIISYIYEELDGRAVSALGVRSRKLSTGLNGQS